MVIITTSTARLICCFCSRTSLYTTAACSTARTPRRPAGNSAIDSWTSTASTAGVWRGKNNYNRSKRQQPRRTMYHYSWLVLKRFWLLGYVNWSLKVSFTACPGNICFFFFFLTTEPQTGGFNLILHLTLTWQTRAFWGAEHLAKNADLLTSLLHRHAQWNQNPGKINEGQKNLSFHFFKKRKVVE